MIEYKYCVSEYENPTNIFWEKGPNRLIELSDVKNLYVQRSILFRNFI